MAEDILDMFNPGGMEGSRASNGGQMPVKELPYSPPAGPKGIGDSQSPGIHGTNHGNAGTQGKR